MEILMIDDSDFKITAVEKALKDRIDVVLDIAKSFNSGMRKLDQNKYDGLILDMQFPQFDEEPWTIKSDNGMKVLRMIKLSARLKHNRDIPIMMFSSTQTDVSEYNKNVKAYVLYSSTYYLDAEILKFIEDIS